MPGFPPMQVPDFGFAAFFWLVAILFVVGLIWRGRANYVTGAPVVLKRFRVNENAITGPAVEISGRASGLISWILNLMNLEPGIELTVTDTEVSIRSASLAGVRHTYIPLGKITAAVCGYQRSIWALGFTILFGLGTVISFSSSLVESHRRASESDARMGVLFLILTLVALLFYSLSKKIGVAVEAALHAHGVAFKRSVIENVSVDLPQALHAIEVINNRILAAQTVKTVSLGPDSGPRPFETDPTASSGGGREGRCPKCSNPYAPGIRFCENCGFELPSRAA